MKWNRRLVWRCLLPLVCVSVAACESESVDPLPNNYEVITHSGSSDQIELDYRSVYDQSVIWPDITVALPKNDLVLFSGYTSSRRMRAHDTKNMDLRIFVVHAPQPPLDITNEVLWHQSQDSGQDFTDLLKTVRFASLEEVNDAVMFHFEGASALNVKMTWNQVADIMRDVQRHGVVHKDPTSGATYIVKDLQSAQ